MKDVVCRISLLKVLWRGKKIHFQEETSLLKRQKSTTPCSLLKWYLASCKTPSFPESRNWKLNNNSNGLKKRPWKLGHSFSNLLTAQWFLVWSWPMVTVTLCQCSSHVHVGFLQAFPPTFQKHSSRLISYVIVPVCESACHVFPLFTPAFSGISPEVWPQ